MVYKMDGLFISWKIIPVPAGNGWFIPSGYVKMAIENGHKSFVSFPILNGDFPSLL